MSIHTLRKKVCFQLGVHPINWMGEDIMEHGSHYTYQEILNEIHDLGFNGVEMSRSFPREIKVLQDELYSRDIRLITQWKWVHFSKAENQEKELRSYRKHAEFLKEMGSCVISTAEWGGSFLDPSCSKLTRKDDWEWLCDGLNRAGRIAQEHGMKLTYHHHGETGVETEEEIDQLMEMTQPDLVYLLYDTGHAMYGRVDPLQLLQKYYHRIAYVHLKDVRLEVLENMRKHKENFLSCIRKGVFTLPGDGGIHFTPIVEELMQRNYTGWVVLEGEQDPIKNHPMLLSARAIEHIEQIVTNWEE